MKRVLFILSLFFTCALQAQVEPKLVNRLYFSRESVITNTPDTTYTLQCILYEKVGPAFGNKMVLEYLPSESDSLQGLPDVNKVYAFAYEGSLYLNGKYILDLHGFMKAETHGRFMLLMTLPVMDYRVAAHLGLLKEQTDAMQDLKQAYFWQHPLTNMKEYPIVYDIIEEVVYGFSKKFMLAWMNLLPVLKEKYQKIPFKKLNKTEFINDINEALTRPGNSESQELPPRIT